MRMGGKSDRFEGFLGMATFLNNRCIGRAPVEAEGSGCAGFRFAAVLAAESTRTGCGTLTIPYPFWPINSGRV